MSTINFHLKLHDIYFAEHNSTDLSMEHVIYSSSEAESNLELVSQQRSFAPFKKCPVQ